MNEIVVKRYRSAVKFVYSELFLPAVKEIRGILQEARRLRNTDLDFLSITLNDCETSIRSIINYSIQSNSEPDKLVVQEIQRRLLSVLDKAKVSSYHPLSEQRDTTLLTRNLTTIREFYRRGDVTREGRDIATREIFDYLLSAFFISSSEESILNSVFSSGALTEREKAVVVSALTLSLFKEFDERKINILASQVSSPVPSVSVRASVALVLVCYLYNERLKIYKELHDKIARISAEHRAFFVEIYIQLLKSKFTNPNDSLISQVSDSVIKNSGLKNLPLDKVISSESDELFSRLSDKLSGFINKQTEGWDVNFHPKLYLGYSQITENSLIFFLPFSLDESFAADAFASFSEDMKKAVKLMSSNQYICDLDKFQTIFSLQKAGKMLGNAMNSIPSDIDSVFTNVKYSRKDLLRNYIFNLYRFYIFAKAKSSFKNPFNSSLHLYKTSIFEHLSPDSVDSITNLFYANHCYDEIIEIIDANKLADGDNEVFLRKKGIAQHCKGMFRDAFETLERANIYKERAANFLLMFDYFNEIRNTKKAIECLTKAAKLKPKDVAIKVKLAEFLSSSGDFDSALSLFQYLDYELNENEDSFLEQITAPYLKTEKEYARSLALHGKTDAAREHAEVLRDKFSSALSVEDRFLVVHLTVLPSNYSQAVNLYAGVITNYGLSDDCDSVLSIFDRDSSILSALGISLAMQKILINDVYAKLG